MGRFFKRGAPPCDEGVLRDLFERYWTALYRQARLLLPAHRDPENAAADVWLQVVRERKSYDPAKSQHAWLARICTRVCLDRRRFRRRHWVGRPAAEDGPQRQVDAADAERILHAHELRETLHRAVGRLPRRAREVVLMRFFFGCSVPEIAALRGKPPETISKVLVRGLRRLRVSREAPALRALLGVTEGTDE
jgi:RNA polymerase sigma-70 factor (ECF subfamily)